MLMKKRKDKTFSFFFGGTKQRYQRDNLRGKGVLQPVNLFNVEKFIFIVI